MIQLDVTATHHGVAPLAAKPVASATFVRLPINLSTDEIRAMVREALG